MPYNMELFNWIHSMFDGASYPTLNSNAEYESIVEVGAGATQSAYKVKKEHHQNHHTVGRDVISTLLSPVR